MSDSEIRPDATGLRVLAHPARVELVHLLRAHGPSTASRLADLMGVHSGTASYHLRQLAAGGFVTELADRGNGRERWWQATQRQTALDDIELADADTGAARTFLQSVAATHAMHTQRALSEFATLPRRWRDVFDMSEIPLRLTVEQAAELKARLHEVVASYPRDGEDTAADDAERALVLLYLHPGPTE